LKNFKKILLKRFLVIIGALIIDQLLGDPPNYLHPVGIFGSYVTFIQKRLYANSKIKGAVFFLSSLLLPIITALMLPTFLEVPFMGLLLARKSLQGSIRSIKELLIEGDLIAAREVLQQIVSRDVNALDEAGIVKAAIESLAENTNDAVISPIVNYLILGSPGLVSQKAVDTLDSMVGYKTDKYLKFGFVSAIADDIINRLSGIMMYIFGVFFLTKKKRSFQIVRSAMSHPSFNAGLVEALYAAVLGINLGGNYVSELKEKRPEINFGFEPQLEDLDRAIKLSDEILIGLLLTIGAICILS
jgi:adenosylcobinamide-phosphate synthase